jgi:tetratricopeptide (TPR) repeat protein
MVKAATAKRHANARANTIGLEVGRRLRQARLERGMSLAAVGGEDLSRSFLSLVELGRSRISLRALSIVADRLELPISYFLEDAPDVSEAVAELTLDRAQAALSRQEPEECLRLLESASVPEELHARERWLRGAALIETGRPRDAIPVLQEGVQLAEQQQDPRMVLEFRYKLGLALYGADNYDEALIHLRHVLDDAADGFEDPVLTGRAVVSIGHLLYLHNDVEGAIEHYARARAIFESLADLSTLGSIYSGLSRAYERKGDLENALRYSKLSLGAFEAVQHGRQIARELNSVAVGYRALDDLDQALECAREAVTRAQQVKALDVEALAHSTIASIQLRLENFEVAESEAQAANQLSSNDTDLARIDAWIVLAKLAERRGDHARTDELYTNALENLRRIGNHRAFTDAAYAYSLLLRERGNTEAALEWALQAAQARPANFA